MVLPDETVVIFKVMVAVQSTKKKLGYTYAFKRSFWTNMKLNCGQEGEVIFMEQ